MDYSELIISGFWETMTGFTPLFVPFIAVLLIIRLVASFIFDKR